jgi:hypothetical protein
MKFRRKRLYAPRQVKASADNPRRDPALRSNSFSTSPGGYR